MFSIHTILHPTDFSKPAEYAFHLACSLARDHGARVVVLHVASSPISYGELLAYLPPDEFKEKLWDSLRAIQHSDPEIRELRVETEMAEGDPAREIVRTAQDIGCDLIVMGTHGRTGLERLLMGSVAERVVRKAPCPVLTAKASIAKSAAKVAERAVAATPY